METKKQNPNPSYVTPDACPPDMKNGGYMSFVSDMGTTTYFQVTNELNLWLKTVSKEGHVMNVITFNGEAAQKLIEYIRFREKMVNESMGVEIDNHVLSSHVEPLDPKRESKGKPQRNKKKVQNEDCVQ